MAGVSRRVTAFISSGDTQYWWATFRYPNDNPDIFIDWSVRPVKPPGHAAHEDHIMELVRLQVQRTAADFVYLFEIRNTGAHDTDFELLASWTEF